MRWFVCLCFMIAVLIEPRSAQAKTLWTDIADVSVLADDDLARHSGDPQFLSGLNVSETRFSEAGFDWHLLRFVNQAKAIGPLWAVPHDDENAAFEAAIAAVKLYGGTVIAVNSGPGSSRFQMGSGTCGGRPGTVLRCDPNRNFSAGTPLYTGTFLDQLTSGQPVIALHTNTPGFGKGFGDITMLDSAVVSGGTKRARFGGHFGKERPAILDNYDTYAIIPYLPPEPTEAEIACRNALTENGVHVWHERVGRSDGSLSNYIALNLSVVAYVNMESRREEDINLAAERHGLMIAAYLKGCTASGDQPTP